MPTWEARETSGRDCIEFAVSGELDLAAAEDFEQALLDSLGRAGDVLTLDLDGVTFIDSSALQALMRVVRRADGDGLAVRVTAASPVVRRVFELSGVDTVIDLSKLPGAD